MSTQLIIYLFVFSVFFTSCLAQKKVIFNSNKKVFSDFCKDLKSSNIIYTPDTLSPGLGVYEKIAGKYFDEIEMKKNFSADSSKFNEITKFVIVQIFITSLHSYLKNIPRQNLKIIEYTKSKNLSSGWENDGEEDVMRIRNSLLIVFKDEKKEIEIMVINFNPKNNKIVFLTDLIKSVEDSKFLTDLITNSSKPIY